MSVEPLLRVHLAAARPNGSSPPNRRRRMWSRRVDRRRRTVVVRVEGELDASGQPEFRSTLERAVREPCRAVVVDLRATRFLGIRCAATILEVAKRASGQGVAVRVVTGAPAVERALEITGVRSRCGRHPSMRAALDG
ncbi:STAS domain-containing protein [Nocardia sp. NPDC005366]|uniref:STAS domain-containing protein n=1 Tax=Nocardia sp. NPDC005366 TaxID=3156878 RepID=UPI0033A5D657